MPSFLKSFKESVHPSSSSSHGPELPRSSTNFYGYDVPPEWAPAPEKSHKWGKYNEASADDYEEAERFCQMYPLQQPAPVPSVAIDRMKEEGAKAWGLDMPPVPRFQGHVENIPFGGHKGDGVVKVKSEKGTKDSCLLSNLPILAGMYDVKGKLGFYYEIKVQKMEGVIAIGTACRPYPLWRLPGWNRMSAGLHLDDMRKFFEDPSGGRDYDHIKKIHSGDYVGCGYEFQTGHLFFTYNGMRLPDAFEGIYLPRRSQDVFAAIGVDGECKFEVNFGAQLFKWTEGNEWQWKVDGLTGQLSDDRGFDEELPSYSRT